MSNKVNLNQVAKDLVQATKELSKDKDAEQLAVSKLQRRNVQLSASNQELERKNQRTQKQLEELQDDIVAGELRNKEVSEKNKALEAKNTELQSKVEQSTKELADIETALETKKANLDSDLEAYSLTRKQEIKDSILAFNKELETVKTELQQLNGELESRKTELSELNQVYLDEQQAIKISSAETEEKLTANREIVAEMETKIEELQQELKELGYKKSGILVTLAKAKEEHEKFVEYERRARKILDTKDKELQEKSANIATESQFLKNRRSFLPEM